MENATRQNPLHLAAVTLRALSVLMVWVMFGSSIQAEGMGAPDVPGPSQAPASSGPTIKERVSQIPAGSVVQIRLTNKEQLKGKIGSVSEEGVVLKNFNSSKARERLIAYSEIQSIGVAKSGSKALKIIGIVGLVWLVLVVIVLVQMHEAGGHG